MDLLARLHIPEHRAGGVENRHQGRRRNDPDPTLLRVGDDLGMVGMDLGKHRFCRHEHHRPSEVTPGSRYFDAIASTCFLTSERKAFWAERRSRSPRLPSNIR